MALDMMDKFEWDVIYLHVVNEGSSDGSGVNMGKA